MEQRTCAVDGCDRPIGIKKAGLCSRCYQREWKAKNLPAHEAAAARYNAKRRLDPPAAKTCKACQREFIPTSHSQVFCPPTDADKARVTAARRRGSKSTARSRCAKRWENANSRGTVHHLPDLPPIAPYDCAQCGQWCVPGKNVAPHAKRFCGARCKSTFHREFARRNRRAIVLVGRDPRRIAEWRSHCAMLSIESAFGRLSSREAEREYRRALRRDPCAYCGGESAALDHIDPRSAGGVDGVENRTAACRLCNSLKGTIPLLAALPWIPIAAEYHAMRRILYAAP